MAFVPLMGVAVTQCSGVSGGFNSSRASTFQPDQSLKLNFPSQDWARASTDLGQGESLPLESEGAHSHCPVPGPHHGYWHPLDPMSFTGSLARRLPWDMGTPKEVLGPGQLSLPRHGPGVHLHASLLTPPSFCGFLPQRWEFGCGPSTPTGPPFRSGLQPGSVLLKG